MKRLLLLCICLPFVLGACSKESTAVEGPQTDPVNEELKSLVSNLEKTVLELSQQVSKLNEEIDSLKNINSDCGEFEVGGLKFGPDGKIISPLKKITFMSSGYTKDSSKAEYTYDEYGRLATIKHVGSNRKDWIEYYRYDNMKLFVSYDNYNTTNYHHEMTYEY